MNYNGMKTVLGYSLRSCYHPSVIPSTQNDYLGEGYSSVLECSPSMHEIQSSVPSLKINKPKKSMSAYKFMFLPSYQ